MKLITIILVVHFPIFADVGKGGSKFCKSVDMKLDELKDMIEEKECPSPGEMKIHFSSILVRYLFVSEIFSFHIPCCTMQAAKIYEFLVVKFFLSF